MIYVVIAQNKQDAKIIKQALDLKYLIQPVIENQPLGYIIHSIIIKDTIADHRVLFNEFQETFIDYLSKDNVTVILCKCDPALLNPLKSLGTESLCAMLILAFPETNWIFSIRPKCEGTLLAAPKQIKEFRQQYSIVNLFRADFCNIFDGHGLRKWIRSLMIEDKDSKNDAAYLPLRNQMAVAVDDEASYAHLHAYAAYRFGYRGIAASTGDVADLVLGEKAKELGAEKPAIVFEDIYLSFSVGGKHGLSDFPNVRSNKLPLLEDAENRILVTAASRREGDNKKWSSNLAYLDSQKAQGKRIRWLFKPHSGIFSLWKKAGLKKGKEFIWPPAKGKFSDSEHGHSAPEMLLTIADSLINRAAILLKESVHSVQEAVRGAVLANEALELLGGRTPTESIEALSLKHQFEVLAECQYSGVEFNLDVNSRLEDIKKEVTGICEWFGARRKKDSALNAEMSIITAIMRIFKEYGQFDEEQTCLARVRHLHNTLWMRTNRLRWLAMPVLRYLEFLLSSFPRFLFAILGWTAGLTLLYWFTGDGSCLEVEKVKYHYDFYHGFQDAITSFFSIGGPIHQDGIEINKSGYTVVTCLAVVSGFFHLGVFISHLYSMISRR